MLNHAASAPESGVPEHQRAVDEIQAAVRAEGAGIRRSILKPPPPAPCPSRNPLDHWIAEEIECIRRHLEMLGGILANDPLLITRHSQQLQCIDRMNQLLGHLARVIEAEDKRMAIERVTLQDLRSRLQRKPLTPFGA